MIHADAEDLAVYALGQLSPSARAEIEIHLRDCPECLHMVVMHRELRDLDLVGQTDQGESTVRPTGAGTALGIAGALVGLLGLVRGSGGLAPAALAARGPEGGEEPVRNSSSESSNDHADHDPAPSGATNLEGAPMTDTGHDPFFQEAPQVFGSPAVTGTSTYVQQHANDTCAIQCQRLILNDFGVDVSEEQLAREAEQQHLYTPGEGTPPDAVGVLLEDHGIEVNRFQHANVFHLANELGQGHKVIVGVESGELWQTNDVRASIAHQLGFGHADHAVIVSGIDTADPDHVKVIITDPGTGDVAKAYPLNEFLDAWKTSDFTMVSTAAPLPNWHPEMVNFDYSSGHIASVGAVPFGVAHELSLATHGETDPAAIDHLTALFMSAVDGQLSLDELTGSPEFHSVTHGPASQAHAERTDHDLFHHSLSTSDHDDSHPFDATLSHVAADHAGDHAGDHAIDDPPDGADRDHGTDPDDPFDTHNHH